jgi:hypothetical protein
MSLEKGMKRGRGNGKKVLMQKATRKVFVSLVTRRFLCWGIEGWENEERFPRHFHFDHEAR